MQYEMFLFKFLENPIVPNSRFKHETCKVIATECCSYLLDNTGNAVYNFCMNKYLNLTKDYVWINTESILGPIWNHLSALVKVSGEFIILLLYTDIIVLICFVRLLLTVV